MSSSAEKTFLDLIRAYMGKLYIEDLATDREALEDAAMERVCPYRCNELAKVVHETPDKDLLAIVTKAEPCGQCGK